MYGVCWVRDFEWRVPPARAFEHSGPPSCCPQCPLPNPNQDLSVGGSTGSFNFWNKLFRWMLMFVIWSCPDTRIVFLVVFADRSSKRRIDSIYPTEKKMIHSLWSQIHWRWVKSSHLLTQNSHIEEMLDRDSYWVAYQGIKRVWIWRPNQNINKNRKVKQSTRVKISPSSLVIPNARFLGWDGHLELLDCSVFRRNEWNVSEKDAFF